MNFQTTCPNCKSVFNTNEQQLGAADGWAQCGVCGSPFDALKGLPQEELELYLAQIEKKAVPEQPPEVPTHEQPTRLAEEGADANKESVEKTAIGQADKAASGLPGLERRISEQAAAAQGRSSDLTSIIIVDPDDEAPEDFGPMPEIQPAPNDGRQYEDEDEPDDSDDEEDYDDEDEVTEPKPEAKTEAKLVSRPKPAEANFSLSRRQKKSLTGWQWSLLVLLVLALLGQFVYYLRMPIVARYPGLRPAYASLCKSLGCTMGLPQNIRQIKILGSDLQADPLHGIRLTLGLTLANRADYAQAWPMLQLTLTDTRDNALARRVFAPSEYLGRTGMQERGIPALSETPLSLHLDTRGLSASGFRVEVFY